MTSEMVVTSGSSAVQGPLIGINFLDKDRRPVQLVVHDQAVMPVRPTEPDQQHFLRSNGLKAYRVLGLQAGNDWGFTHGINELGVCVSATGWHGKFDPKLNGISPTYAIRWILHRAKSALQAQEILADLIGRFGVNDGHHAGASFLIADGRDAFHVEAIGQHWALNECRQIRVVTSAPMIHQDWDRLSPGLSERAIENGWWPDEGQKVDFARCLGGQDPRHLGALKRWARLALVLEQQNGHIDATFLGRQLHDHFNHNGALFGSDRFLLNTWLVSLREQSWNQPVWCSFGMPRVALFFPIWLQGDLPTTYAPAHPEATSLPYLFTELETYCHAHPDRITDIVRGLSELQTKFEKDAEHLQSGLATLHGQGNHDYLRSQATDLMHRHVNLFEREMYRWTGREEPRSVSVNPMEDSAMYFA